MGDKIEEVRRAELATFADQIKWADVIYLAGGDFEQFLIEQLRENETLKDDLKNKVLAGSSAGANAMSTYYYGLDDFKLKEGVGLLPLKTIVHYRSDYNAPNIDWDKAEAELKTYKENLPVLCLREGEFEVFEQ